MTGQGTTLRVSVKASPPPVCGSFLDAQRAAMRVRVGTPGQQGQVRFHLPPPPDGFWAPVRAHVA